MQPKEVTDPKEARKIFGEMLKKVHPDFNELAEEDYPNQSIISLIMTELYFKKNSGPYHISVLLPSSLPTSLPTLSPRKRALWS